jgi:hypothetical protein
MKILQLRVETQEAMSPHKDMVMQATNYNCHGGPRRDEEDTSITPPHSQPKDR